MNESFRTELPRHGEIFQHLITVEVKLVPGQIRFAGIDDAPVIVVYRPVVAGIFQLRHILHINSRQDDLSGADGVKEKEIVVPVLHRRRRIVQFIILPQRNARHISVCAGHRRRGKAFDNLCTETVSFQFDFFAVETLLRKCPEIELIHHAP